MNKSLLALSVLAVILSAYALISPPNILLSTKYGSYTRAYSYTNGGQCAWWCNSNSNVGYCIIYGYTECVQGSGYKTLASGSKLSRGSHTSKFGSLSCPGGDKVKTWCMIKEYGTNDEYYGSDEDVDYEDVPGEEECTDECSYSGETKYYCSGDKVYKKTCGNYDSDPCLEWSSGSFVEDCNSKDGWYCKDSYTREYRDYYCSGGSCTYSTTKTEKCSEGYKCSNGQCVVDETQPRECSSTDDFSISIESVSPSKSEYEPGEYITVKVEVKNKKSYKLKGLVEVGVVPKGTWGLSYIMPMAVVKKGDCCEGQENIEDAWIEVDPGKTETIELQVRLPYSGIEDKCGNTQYWNGPGTYVIYAGVFKDCAPDNQKCSSITEKEITIKEHKPPEVSEWFIEVITSLFKPT